MSVSPERWSESELRCALVWRLARRHGWANWVSADALVNAVPTHERGRARTALADLRRTPFTSYHRSRGYKIDHSGIDALADFLRDECGYGEFRIEATLSHFDGFE